jgi:hypothetical protein
VLANAPVFQRVHLAPQHVHAGLGCALLLLLVDVF